ncbi:MAG: response regulator [Thermodesulfobacteriota bacterium]|nr:response regulator [Thermodesulfobacteriota bacterium]
MKILIAEDDRVAWDVVKAFIHQMGHEPVPASDGQEAFEILQRQKIQMLITDYVMPRMSGVELTQAIRNADISFYVYIIFLTGKESKIDAIASLSAGADDYLVKPVDADELQARIRNGMRILKLEQEQRQYHIQMMHSEKMVAVGQLAAGVAHEVNNPVGFVSSNLNTLTDYVKDIATVVQKGRRLVGLLENGDTISGKETIVDLISQLRALDEDIDLDFVLKDIVDLLAESREGLERIKKIVIDLKDFAHPGDDQKMVEADINDGLESTLNVVWNELKYKVTLKKDFGDLPYVKCYPQQLNQVFMNIFVNAAHAIEKKGEVSIETRVEADMAVVEISDTGCGIPPENISKIFDPFFTTKEIGKGTGLGMNVAYNIIKNHGGKIYVSSEVGKGTTFKVSVPINGPAIL